MNVTDEVAARRARLRAAGLPTREDYISDEDVAYTNRVLAVYGQLVRGLRRNTRPDLAVPGSPEAQAKLMEVAASIVEGEPSPR